MLELSGPHAARLSALVDMVNGRLQSHLDEVDDGGHSRAVDLARHVLLAGGKRLRPVIGLLAYEIMGGTDIDQVMPVALAFELIHTATLVHDDINDNAKLRRGVPTLHERFTPAEAIIAGDFLFVQGFRLAAPLDSTIVDVIGRCCVNMVSAELAQIDQRGNVDAGYIDQNSIIRGKTAGLFAACCQSAGYLAGASSEQTDVLYSMGEEIGIAFQLVDDLLDLRGDKLTGKAVCMDLFEGKFTLPVLHAIDHLEGDDHARFLQYIQNFHERHIDETLSLIERSGGFRRAEEEVLMRLNVAGSKLIEIAPASESRDMLVQLLSGLAVRRS